MSLPHASLLGRQYSRLLDGAEVGCLGTHAALHQSELMHFAEGPGVRHADTKK